MQVIGEQLLAISETLRLVSLVKASLQPGSLVASNDKGAGCTAERIGVDLKQTMFILTENECEGVKHLVRAEPDIPGPPQFYVGLELGSIVLAHYAIHTISG